MKIFKLLTAFLLIFSMAITFCACDDGDDKSDDGKRIGDWTIENISCRISNGSRLYVSFSCTNNGEESDAFMMDIEVSVYQNGVELGPEYGVSDRRALGNLMPGASATYEYGGYKLDSDTADIEVEFKDFYGKTISRTFKIKDCLTEE